MMSTFEEQEQRRLEHDQRRLDLAERELDQRERALEMEQRNSAKYLHDADSNIADREARLVRDVRHDEEWRVHRDNVERTNEHHGAVLERIAAALEAIAAGGARTL
jgi:hypothetical protein